MLNSGAEHNLVSGPFLGSLITTNRGHEFKPLETFPATARDRIRTAGERAHCGTGAAAGATHVLQHFLQRGGADNRRVP